MSDSVERRAKVTRLPMREWSYHRQHRLMDVGSIPTTSTEPQVSHLRLFHKANTRDRPPYGQQVTQAHVYYPASDHDATRICARLIEKHTQGRTKDHLVTRSRICGKMFTQWTSLQDDEPWALCLDCFEELSRKRKRE